jgi:Ala-tRNA(Pro) deacylase
MPICQRVRDYLDSQKVKYNWLPHPETFPAYEAAQVLHVPGKQFAKAVVVLGDNRLIMAVLPA